MAVVAGMAMLAVGMEEAVIRAALAGMARVRVGIMLVLAGMGVTGMALTGMALTGMALTGMALTGMAAVAGSMRVMVAAGELARR
jgi:hypothetical protein